MLKACSRCGQVHDDSSVCHHGQHRKFNKTDETKLRSRYSWKQKRAEIRDRAFELCEVCMDEGDYSKKDLEVHHIVKLKDDPSGFLENENLISLCVKHHKMADDGELSVEYLTSLALEREERTRR